MGSNVLRVSLFTTLIFMVGCMRRPDLTHYSTKILSVDGWPPVVPVGTQRYMANITFKGRYRSHHLVGMNNPRFWEGGIESGTNFSGDWKIDWALFRAKTETLPVEDGEYWTLLSADDTGFSLFLARSDTH
jgi:hypothetical protein